MFYFYGKWKRNIDDRGRIYSPPVFRKKLKKCIITLNKGNIQICEKGELPFPEIYPLKLDKERRISIPLQLRKGWTGKVIELIGKGEYLEIRRI
ncbi:MAG: hypothetical protein Q8N73_01525 [bacterium]|nr:hypothetical protein [bacterium]